MRNLLRNDFVTLFKSKIFWLAIAVLLGVLWLYDENYWSVQDILDAIEKNRPVSHCYLHYLCGVFSPSMLSFFFGGVIPLVIGYDFDGGMLRNKIMAGHSRIKIYFSTLIESLTCGLIFMAVSVVYCYCTIMKYLGFYLVNEWMKDSLFTEMLVSQFLITLFAVIAIVSLAVSLTMSINLKAIAIIVYILFYSFFMYFGQPMRLYATDINPTVSWINENNEVETAPNPYYIPADAPEKKIFLTLDAINMFASFDGLPLENMHSGNYAKESVRYVLGSAAMTIVINSAGIFVFNKRNLK